jgi:hypothetical protein
MKEKKKSEMKGSLKKHWRDEIAKTKKEREAQAKKFPHCFLDPPRYPICRKNSAVIEEKGLRAAELRARLNGEKNIVEKVQSVRQSLSRGRSSRGRSQSRRE